MQHPLNIAVLISGNGSNLQALIDDQKRHSELYRIALVVSNKAEAFGLQRAQSAGIATCVISHNDYPDRASFDRAMQHVIDAHHVQLVVLAGFMRILSAEFTQHYLGRMLNIHPSLLPKYPGLHTHQQALDNGDAEHGLSVHFVTAELDGGPLILQARVAVTADDDAASLQQKVHQQEHRAYPLAVRWFAAGKLQWQNEQAWFNGRALIAPLQFENLPVSD